MESGANKSAPSYWAFISYSSKDRATARWLHRRIENYAIPKEFQTISFSDGTPLGKHLRPVFRDRDELSGSADLGPAISRALAQSRYLIVLCSRNSAKSTWVNKEILEFQAAGKERNILALILDGEPNATSNPSVPDEDECFPPALRYPAEPLAGDLRKSGDGPERGFLKVLAGMAQLDFDGLYRRHERAQRRRRLVIGSLAAVIMVALTGLSWFALVKKSEADAQRKTAEQEKGRAMRNEQEAKQQRDLARSHLSRFYREKAQDGDAGTAASLAWALRAAETNPSLLDSPGFQGQIALWAGPFPAPDRCDPTGLKPSTESWNNYEHHLSRRHRRMVVQGTDSSWSLLAWDGAKPLASGFTSGPIRSFVSPGEEAWFALVSVREVELRSWEDGRLVARYVLDGKGILSAAAATTSELLLALHDSSEEKDETRLLAWNPVISDRPSAVGPPVKGELLGFEASTDGEGLRLIGIRRHKGENQRVLWSRTSPESEWVDKPEAPGSSRPVLLSYSGQFGHPPGVKVLFRAEPPHEVHELKLGAQYRLDLSTDEELVGLCRKDSGLAAFVSRKSDPTSIELMELSSGTRTPLFGGVPVTDGKVDPDSGTFAAWDERTKSLRIRKPDGGEFSRTIRLPQGLDFTSFEILRVSKSWVLIEGGTFPGGYEGLMVVDLEAPEGHDISFLRVPGVRDWLEVSVDIKTGASLRLLSHRKGAVSSARNIPTVHDLSQPFGERIYPGEGTPQHLEVTNDGQFRLLAKREKDGADELRWSGSGSKAPWIRAQGQLDSNPNISSSRDGHLCWSDNYRESMLIGPSGELDWKDKEPAGGGIQSVILGGRKLLLHHDAASVSLLDPKSETPLWKQDMPDSLAAIQVIEDQGRILLATETRNFDDSRPKIALREWKLSDGTQTAAWPLELEKLESYGSSFEILGSSQPLLLVDQQSAGGDLHDCVLYQPGGGTLVERMRWQRPARVPAVTLPGKGILVDCSDAAGRDHQAALLVAENGALRRVPIPLAGPLQSIHPDPTGRRCLFVMEDSMMLWDLEASAPIGGLLTLGKDHGREIRPNHLYKPLWNNDGTYLYLSYSRFVYQLDGLTGELIRIRNEHTPAAGPDGECPDVAKVALSPDGSWLASVDATGVVRLSRTSSKPMNLETLREFSHRAGGYQINEGGDLVPWEPSPK